MTLMNPAVDRKKLFHVRPLFLLGCVAFLVVLILPDAIRGRDGVRHSLLLFATLAIVMGWFFLMKYHEPNTKWRALVALLTSIYVTASVPVFLFELSPTRWLVRHPHHYTFEMYSWPWVHGGYQGFVPLFLGVVGCFFGSGRARVAFVTGGILLLVLRASMGTWVY